MAPHDQVSAAPLHRPALLKRLAHGERGKSHLAFARMRLVFELQMLAHSQHKTRRRAAIQRNREALECHGSAVYTPEKIAKTAKELEHTVAQLGLASSRSTSHRAPLTPLPC